jgi:hypothetical protein
MSEPKFRAEAEERVRQFCDDRRMDLAELNERTVRLDLAREICGPDVPALVVWLVGQALHTSIIHPWLRRVRRAMRAYDPAQLEMWPLLQTDYVVMRDGFERGVPLNQLDRTEILQLAQRKHRTSLGVRRWADRDWRHARQLLDYYSSTHPAEPWTETELSPFADAMADA